MAFTIEELKRAPEGAMYVSPERICVTSDGELCGEDDPRAVKLLVAKGGEIPASEAAAYGLVIEANADDDDQAEEAVPISRMLKGDLLALASERGIDVPEGATVADLRELLSAPGDGE